MTCFYCPWLLKAQKPELTERATSFKGPCVVFNLLLWWPKTYPPEHCRWTVGDGPFLPLQNDLFRTSAGSKFQFSSVAEKSDGNQEDNDYGLQAPQFGLIAKFQNSRWQVSNAQRLNTQSLVMQQSFSLGYLLGFLRNLQKHDSWVSLSPDIQLNCSGGMAQDSEPLKLCKWLSHEAKKLSSLRQSLINLSSNDCLVFMSPHWPSIVIFNKYVDFSYASTNLKFLVHTKSLFVNIDLLKSPAMEQKMWFLLIVFKYQSHFIWERFRKDISSFPSYNHSQLWFLDIYISGD